MWAHELSSPIYEYVQGVCKGSGETLGNIAAQARTFESEMNAWNEDLDVREDLEDGR